ncbi:MAG: aminotransferase class III-fold pyridoxal phosphate-dependent enzyme, partial [Firmicutes bacterium]|nr:aminotransferase class III-fold pyridoxal phosphate-dependent enzyme [Bacillota bacterium]
AARMGLAVTSWLESAGLDHVQKMALKLEQALSELAQAYSGLIVNYRGRGLMWGLEVSVPAADIVQKGLDYGVIMNAAQPHIVRLLPPLVIQDDSIQALTDVLSAIFSGYASSVKGQDI